MEIELYCIHGTLHTAVAVLFQQWVENCTVQLTFNTTYAMVLEKNKPITDAEGGRNGVEMFNRNMAQFSSTQCFKPMLVYNIMCNTEERAPYSPTFLTDG